MKRRAGGLGTLLLVAAAALGVRAVQPALFKAHAHARETSDVFLLPPPREVVLLSLGYRAALADLLWSDVLVSQGLHTMQKRRFENLTRLLDTINELDPEFREPYLMADALITFQANTTPHEEIVKAREIMERGTRNRPLDAEVWLVLGQFVAFIAPAGYLTDKAEIAQWRDDGARYLARAAELGGEDASISWQALGGASILRRAGETDAAIRFLRRALATTDNEELRAQIQAQLDGLEHQNAEAVWRRDSAAAFNGLWHGDVRFVTKDMFLLLGPPPDPAYCAGGEHGREARCAVTWKAWADRRKPEAAAP